MSNIIELRLLGPVQVHRDGQAVRGFESRKSLALLGYLAVRAQPVSRIHLADLFWPSLPESRGRANLSVVLHNLTVLVPGCLTADRQLIAFQPSTAVWLDIAAFEALVAQGTPEALAAAVQLYRDDFMGDRYLDDCADIELWLAQRREEWCMRVIEVLQVLVHAHAQRGEDAKAIAFLRRWLALEPLCETAHCQLMDFLARTGHRGAALAEYETFRQLLTDELHVEPAAQTKALYERLCAGEIAVGASAQAAWAMQDRPLVMFAGEEGPDQPDDAFFAAVHDRGRVVALTAEQLNALARQPAVDLQSYRLGRIAEWSQPVHRLDRRFVALTMLVDQGEEAMERWRAQERRYDDLGNLLDEVRKPALVLLGSPGSGKSTLLRRLELDIAAASLRDESPVVTFLVTLSRYRADGSAAEPPDPLAWLGRNWRERYPDLPPLERWLTEGRLLLLVDGLNEMPHANFSEYQACVTRWKDFLTEAIAGQPGNRAVFACRSLDYSAPLSTPILRVPQVRIEPLDDEQIRQFLVVHSPKRAEMIWSGLQATAQLEVVRTPYVLKLLIDQVRSEGELARGRAAMFTGFVRGALRREIERDNALFRSEALLSEHDHRRLAQARRWRTPYELPEHGPLIPNLSRLAYEMQVSRSASEGLQVRVSYDDALGLVVGDNPQRSLRAGEALGLVDHDLDLDEVRFRHQLLQEYFAARRLAEAPNPELVRAAWRADEVRPSVRELIDILPLAETLPALPTTGWEETTLLAAAMAGDAEAFVRGVMTTNLALAGRCAVEAEVRLRLGDSFLDELRWSLVDRSRNPEADLRDRIACGLAAGELGDPRFERRVGRHGEYLLPPMVRIPGGTYPIGDDDNFSWLLPGTSETIIESAHRPRHQVQLAEYRIAQFLTTNAQWRSFMSAGGYQDERWWDTAGARAWRAGNLDDEGAKENNRIWRRRFSEHPELFEQMVKAGHFSNDETIERWQHWILLDERQFEAALNRHWRAKQATEPEFWRDRRMNAPSQPVVGICWFEARAYCLWLSAQTGLDYRMPSEVELEAAARGIEGRVYPCGDKFDATRGNSIETHLGRPSPVGVFVDSDTPQGVSDLAGNAMQWTSTAWGGTDGRVPGFAYPYDPNDGREEVTPDGLGWRILRGQAWFGYVAVTRAVYRQFVQPSYRSAAVGLRICLRSPFT